MNLPLTQADISLHESKRITIAMLERMQVRRVTDEEARALLALTRRPGRLDGVVYPYLDPERPHAVGYRLRRDHPEFEGGKPKNKYLSSYGDRHHLYFVCETAAQLHDRSVVVIVVEAEKSAMAVMCAAQQLGRSVIALALGGAYGWRGRIGKVETSNGGHADETGVLPDFDRLMWTQRDVVLVFDSNASSNAAVQVARRQLGAELARRGAFVRVLDLQAEDGINGPDDYLGRYGAEPLFARIDGAPDAAAFDVIFRLNQKHAVVRESGRTLVVTEDYDPVLDRRVVTRSSFDDFRNLYLRESIKVGTRNGEPIVRSLGQVWLTHRDRRQYDGVIMAPNADVPGYLNLWRGFAVTPKPGSCARFQAHVYDGICSGNDIYYNYLWTWLATTVQRPQCRAEVAIALRGPRGTGKGVFARTVGALFGQHFLHISNSRHLVGHFNSHLLDTILLFADEAFWAGDKAGESVLKALVTEPVIPIERKGRDVIVAKNLLHIILASNAEWIVPAGLDERRFFVLDVDAGHQQDHAYFAAITQELEAGGDAALLHELLTHPIEDVDLRDVPQTEALRQQKVLSLSPNERWLLDKLKTGRWLPAHTEWQRAVVKEELHADYIESLKKIGIERRSTATELGMFLKRLLGNHVKGSRHLVNGARRYEWQFDELDLCRQAFDRAMHGPQPWTEDDGEDEG